VISYSIFLVAEYLRPGFVSFVGSVHWWALPIAVCFLILLSGPAEMQQNSSWLGTVSLSILFTFVVLFEGAIFEDFFLLVLFGAASLPIFLRLLLNQEEK